MTIENQLILPGMEDMNNQPKRERNTLRNLALAGAALVTLTLGALGTYSAYQPAQAPQQVQAEKAKSPQYEPGSIGYAAEKIRENLSRGLFPF